MQQLTRRPLVSFPRRVDPLRSHLSHDSMFNTKWCNNRRRSETGPLSKLDLYSIPKTLPEAQEENMADLLGRRDDIVDSAKITRWHLTQLLEQPREYAADEQRSPFPWRNDLNAKIALWTGNITTLNVHAITHSTNEHMNDKNPLSDELFRAGGPGLWKEVKEDLQVCKTGEAKLSKGHNLPSRYVIHTVGPRFNTKYLTAAESALFSCYRSILQLCKQTESKSLGLAPAHTLRRSYPSEKGAHIAIRTVRRFLENHPDAIDFIIFVCNEDNINEYRTILPLYFPRNSKEEEEAIVSLPGDIGNEEGEPIVKDRQIRIMDKPIFAALKAGDAEFEQTIDLNKEFAESMSADVGHHPFASMEEDPDIAKTRNISKQTAKELRHIEIRKNYERFLKKAKSADLTEIAAYHCLYRAGVDKLGRPVIIFVGKNFPAIHADPDKTLLYLIRVMDPVVESNYVVVYFHTETTGHNQPPMAYLRSVYNILDNRYRRNLQRFYIIHPTWWSKLAAWFFTTFTASDIKRKVQSMRGVQFLFQKINADQIDIPSFVQDYDIKINGARYEVPDTDNAEGL